MSTNIPFNGQVYPVPTQGDPAPWGPPLDRYLIALGAGAISPSGGSYPLTADLNLGDNFGVIAKYFTSGSATPATAGTLRLAKGDTIDWRNNANSGNNVLAVDGSDNLTYNGTALQPALGALLDGEIWIGNGSSVATPQTLSGAITTTDTGVTSISSDYITDSMVNSSAAIAYSKLNLSGSIVDSDIFSGAAIALSKLAALTASQIAVTDSSGVVTTTASPTLTELSYLAGVTSAIQTQLNGKQASGSYLTALTGDMTASGPGSAAATLATVNSNVGSFTYASLTVNGKGLITAASNGANPGVVDSGTASQLAYYAASTAEVGPTGSGMTWAIANPVLTLTTASSADTYPVLTLSGGIQFNSVGNAGPVNSATLGGLALRTSTENPFGSTPLLCSRAPCHLFENTQGGGTKWSILVDSNNNVLIGDPGSGNRATFTVNEQLEICGNLSFYTTTGGILGTQTNDNADSLIVGEYIASPVSNVAYAATGVVKDMTSISLTAGDWDVYVSGHIENGGTTSLTDVSWWSSTTSGNSFTGYTEGVNNFRDAFVARTTFSFSAPANMQRYSLGSTTNVYLKSYAGYTSSTPSFDGQISARRVR